MSWRHVSGWLYVCHAPYSRRSVCVVLALPCVRCGVVGLCAARAVVLSRPQHRRDMWVVVRVSAAAIRMCVGCRVVTRA